MRGARKRSPGARDGQRSAADAGGIEVVYQGKRIPALRGRYLVTDFMSGALFALRLPTDGNSPADAWSLGKTGRMVTAFGRAPDGEVWAVDFGAGALLRLDPAGG